MKLMVPSWYPAFHCKAAACRNSCCVGWEIDIDEDSAARYERLPGAVGERLRRGIRRTEEGASFILDERERCPMLEPDGLCALILACGEDALCDICREHPRFYHEYADRTEGGVGLCCEEAARLLLAQTEPLRLIATEDDGAEETPDPAEAALLRLRDALLRDAACDAPLGKRLSMLLRRIGLDDEPEPPVSFWLSLERLDDRWTALLTRLNTELPDAATLAAQENDPRFTRILEYLLYRHVPDAPDTGDPAGGVLLCVRSLRLLRRLCALPDADMADTVRLWSAEIEYSEENLCALRA